MQTLNPQYLAYYSEIMRTAWLTSKSFNVPFNEALKASWKYFRINFVKTNMKTRVVTFYFIKSDNTVRKARGMKVYSDIPEDLRPKGVRKSPASVETFFDVDKQAWRCFKPQTLIRVQLSN